MAPVCWRVESSDILPPGEAIWRGAGTGPELMQVDDGTIPDLAVADGCGGEGIHQTKFIDK